MSVLCIIREGQLYHCYERRITRLRVISRFPAGRQKEREKERERERGSPERERMPFSGLLLPFAHVRQIHPDIFPVYVLMIIAFLDAVV